MKADMKADTVIKWIVSGKKYNRDKYMEYLWKVNHQGSINSFKGLFDTDDQDISKPDALMNSKSPAKEEWIKRSMPKYRSITYTDYLAARLYYEEERLAGKKMGRSSRSSSSSSSSSSGSSGYAEYAGWEGGGSKKSRSKKRKKYRSKKGKGRS
jgi:hypothetical protein